MLGLLVSQLALAAPRTPSCDGLKLPATWTVLSRAAGPVSAAGQRECLLVVWRPWRDWPISRWTSRPSPIRANQDQQGRSAHLALLTPLGGGRYHERWVGSAMRQPALRAEVLSPGHILVWEGRYADGPTGHPVARSSWVWTGFGFRLVQREELTGPR